MNKFFNKKSVAIAAGLVLAQSAFAQSLITNEATVSIYGNNDSSNNSREGVFITSNAGNGAINNDQAYISLTTDGQLFLGSKGGGRRDQNQGMGVSALVEVGSNRVFIDGGGA